MFVNFDWWYHDRRVTKSLTNIGQTMPSWSHHNARADPWLEEAQGGRSAVPSAGLSGRHGQAPSTDQLVLLPAPSCLSLRIHSVALSTFSPAVDLPVIHLLTYLTNSPITKRIYQDTLFLPPIYFICSLNWSPPQVSSPWAQNQFQTKTQGAATNSPLLQYNNGLTKMFRQKFLDAKYFNSQL